MPNCYKYGMSHCHAKGVKGRVDSTEYRKNMHKVIVISEVDKDLVCPKKTNAFNHHDQNFKIIMEAGEQVIKDYLVERFSIQSEGEYFFTEDLRIVMELATLIEFLPLRLGISGGSTTEIVYKIFSLLATYARGQAFRKDFSSHVEQDKYIGYLEKTLSNIDDSIKYDYLESCSQIIKLLLPNQHFIFERYLETLQSPIHTR